MMLFGGTSVLEMSFWTLKEFPERYAILTRTPARIDSLQELVRQNQKLMAYMQPSHRHWGLVVDMRHAPPARNDDGFENAMRPLRLACAERWARLAILTKTEIGKMHVGRLHKEDQHHDVLTTTDEVEARMHAQGRELPPRPSRPPGKYTRRPSSMDTGKPASWRPSRKFPFD